MGSDRNFDDPNAFYQIQQAPGSRLQKRRKIPEVFWTFTLTSFCIISDKQADQNIYLNLCYYHDSMSRFHFCIISDKQAGQRPPTRGDDITDV